MAHFRATIDQNDGVGPETSRTSTAKKGLKVAAQSWQGQMVATLYVGEDGRDHIKIALEPHQYQGVTKYIYDGPIGGEL